MSSSDIAISVRELCKSYTIAHDQEKHSTLAETIISRVRDPLRRPKTETFWALKDVSFEIKKGDVVGIIGRNGAGKSTLLKVLSRITQPTSGEVDLYGRVGSLLEVGTGFHSELTGRENVYLNGAILGMSKAEIKRQFDAIVDFSGVEQFLDTPVKRYSSGMYVRLAFAVAAHLEPEILIVDEVLAVGDAAFQNKCLGRMGEVAQLGRTVLFVSHDMAAIRAICKRGLLLEQGKIKMTGAAATVVDSFLTSIRSAGIGRRVENQAAAFEAVRVLSADGSETQTLNHGQPFQIEIEYVLKAPISTGASIRVSDARGVAAFDCHECIDRAPARAPGRHVTRFKFDNLPLAPARFFVSAFLMVHHGTVTLSAEQLADFNVIGTLRTGVGSVRTFDTGGMIIMNADIRTTQCINQMS